MPTAINPQTGERIELVNGAWVPVGQQTAQSAQPNQDWLSKATGGFLTTGPGNPYLESVLQGVTLGFSDELQAGAKSLLGGLVGDRSTYDEAADEIRNAYRSFSQQNPATSFGLELGGGLLTGGAGAARIGTGKTFAQNLMRQGAAGAGFGGVAGAGYADEGDRLSGALKGATTGAVIGTAIPAAATVAGKVASPVVSMAQNKLSAPATKAARLLARDMQRDRMTPERAAKALRGLGDDAMLADVGGSNMLQLADQVAMQPGAGQNFARGAVRARDIAQGDRVSSALSKALGKPSDFYSNADDLIAKRAADARPLYEEAFKQKSVISDRLQQFLDDPVTKEGLKKGMAVQRLEALRDGRKFDPFDYFDVVNERVVKNRSKYTGRTTEEVIEELTTQGTPNLRALDAAKRGMDEMLEAYRDKTTGRLVLDQYGRALDGVRKELVKELDNLTTNPDTGTSLYAKARSAWAGPSALKDSLEMGRSFIRKDSEVTQKMIGGMSDGEKEMFRLGAARAIQDRIESASDTADIVKRVFGSKAIRSKLEAVFPDKESFRSFEKAMRNEARFARTKAATAAGSQTQPRQAKALDIGADPGMLADAAFGNIGSAATSGARGLLAGLMNPMDDATSRQLSRMMFSTDPAANQLVLQQIAKRQTPTGLMRSMRLLGGAAPLAGSAQFGGLLASP